MLIMAALLAAGCKPENDNTLNGHEYVDLGLPNGTLWATCNVGADEPEKYGDYFAWGETSPKEKYEWTTYTYCFNGDNQQLTKYCNNTNYGYNGFADNLLELLIEDDAAVANWGGGWRMPTGTEWHELFQNTTYTWMVQNGVNGMRFVGSNGNSIFLPAGDRLGENNDNNIGNFGFYWSSTLYTAPSNVAVFFYLQYNGVCGCNGEWRCRGLSVRPVHSSR